LTGKFDLPNVNDMAFYISGPKLLFETTEILTHPNSTQQKSNYIYLYTTKFGTSIKIWLNWKFESTEFETMRVNCIVFILQCQNVLKNYWKKQKQESFPLSPREFPLLFILLPFHNVYSTLIRYQEISTYILDEWSKEFVVYLYCTANVMG
jgi:hypothetical protein